MNGLAQRVPFHQHANEPPREPLYGGNLKAQAKIFDAPREVSRA